MTAPIPTLRSDLLQLDEDKLATLATRGHVKRAVKDLAAGRGPSLSVEADGTVVARIDDVETRLTAGVPLRDTACSCAALKVCRHRVMAVLAYRRAHGDAEAEEASAWSPATFGDDALADLLGRWALARATRRRKRGLLADVVRGAVPTVELPTCTVRFLVRDALSYARCDCEAGVKCEHIALAVWACRRADERRPQGDRVTVEVGSSATLSAGALDAVSSLGRELLLDGALASGAALAVRFARAKRPLSEAKLRWPLAISEDLERALESYGGRSATYHPAQLGQLLTELHARARAAQRPGEVPARAILGMDEPAETALEHLRLVSLGCRLELERAADDGDRARVSVYLADPDTQTVLVLQKAWDVDVAAARDAGAALARRHLGRGIPLGVLARGQMVTKAAKRRADRTLVLGGGVGRTSVLPQRGDWSLLRPPLHPASFASLREELRGLPPACVRPRVLAASVRVLSVSDVSEVRYHPGEQALSADVQDPSGDSVRLELVYSRAAPGALDALDEALRAGVRYVSGEVWREGDETVMTPLAVVTDRVIVLDIEPAASDPTGLVTRARDTPVRPLQAALIATREHLDRGAHLGLRHLSAAWRDTLEQRTRQLRAVGLKECAQRGEALRTALSGRLGGDPAAEETLALRWLDASLRIRLALEAGL